MNGGETIQHGDALEGTVFTAEPKKETPDGVLDYIRSTGETELADNLKSKPSTILKFTTVPWCTVGHTNSCALSVGSRPACLSSPEAMFNDLSWKTGAAVFENKINSR